MSETTPPQRNGEGGVTDPRCVHTAHHRSVHPPVNPSYRPHPTPHFASPTASTVMRHPASTSSPNSYLTSGDAAWAQRLFWA